MVTPPASLAPSWKVRLASPLVKVTLPSPVWTVSPSWGPMLAGTWVPGPARRYRRGPPAPAPSHPGSPSPGVRRPGPPDTGTAPMARVSTSASARLVIALILCYLPISPGPHVQSGVSERLSRGKFLPLRAGSPQSFVHSDQKRRFFYSNVFLPFCQCSPALSSPQTHGLHFCRCSEKYMGKTAFSLASLF